MTNNKWLGLVLLVLATISLAACSKPVINAPAAPANVNQQPVSTPNASTTAASDWDKVVEAGKKEGKVSYYDAFWAMSPRERDGVFGAFEKATGIKVEVTAMQPPESRQRIQVEQTSGQIVADILASAATAPYDLWKQKYTQPAVVPAGLENGIWRLDPYTFKVTEQNLVVTHFTPGAIILINTNLIKSEDEPKGWNDFLDPKFKGKMVMSDPRIPGSQLWWAAFLNVYGKDYWAKLVKNEPLLVPGISIPIDRVAKGESAIGVGVEVKQTILAMNAGAPLKAVYFADAVPTMPFAVSILKGAPHPNSAKVLINWLLTKEGQTVLSQAGNNTSVRNDVSQDFLPEIARFSSNYKYLWITESTMEAARVETMEYAKDVFGR